jgi:hypothetical protein
MKQQYCPTYRCMLCGVVALFAVAALTGCEQMMHEACVKRLNKHFQALPSQKEVKSADSARRIFSQIASLAETADISGCNSQTVFGVRELYQAAVSAQSALSDGNLLGHVLFDLFDAAESSPATLQMKEAQSRFQDACAILNKNGVGC